MEELDALTDTISKYNHNMCLVLIGDLNALKPTDYNDEQWQRICDVREYNYWESPKTELIDTIENKY